MHSVTSSQQKYGFTVLMLVNRFNEQRNNQTKVMTIKLRFSADKHKLESCNMARGSCVLGLPREARRR